MAAGRTRILFHCPHASAHIAHSSMEKSKHETKEGEKNCDDMESDVTINEWTKKCFDNEKKCLECDRKLSMVRC